MVGLMATPSKRAYATPRSAAPRVPAPAVPTADPHLHRRHSNTQRQVWLSLCGVCWCAHGFVCVLRASLADMRFDSKRFDSKPLLPSCWGFCFAFGCGVSFFGGIQHSPVNGCSAMSGNFGVLTGEGECMFYCAILGVT